MRHVGEKAMWVKNSALYSETEHHKDKSRDDQDSKKKLMLAFRNEETFQLVHTTPKQHLKYKASLLKLR